MPDDSSATTSERAHDTRAAMDALRRLVRALRTSTRAAERAHQMSAAQLFVLRTVAAQPGLALGELAARVHTRQSTASEVVARLANQGFVARRTDPADARRRTLHLTATGRALVRTARRTVPERLVEALEALPAPERAALARGLARWVAAAGLDTVAPTMFFERGADAPAPSDLGGAAAEVPGAR